MDESYPHIKEIRSYQSDLRDGDGSVLIALMFMGVIGMVSGLFIGWMLFSPTSMERPTAFCGGSVEACMSHAEGM